MRFPEIRQQVALAARKAYDSGLVVATSGNYSQLDASSRLVVITPTNFDYERMEAQDLVVIDLDGQVMEGELPPSSEWALHTFLYRQRPDVLGIAHTHSPYATAFALLEGPIPDVLIESHYLCGGTTPVASFAPPGTPELGIAAARAIGQGKAVLLSHHGLATVGASAADALKVAFWVEDTARAYHLARAIGKPRTIAEVLQDPTPRPS
ncbi:MAG: class II aldolase/adducin family protein [Symbiobacteriia bacterium]